MVVIPRFDRFAGCWRWYAVQYCYVLRCRLTIPIRCRYKYCCNAHVKCQNTCRGVRILDAATCSVRRKISQVWPRFSPTGLGFRGQIQCRYPQTRGPVFAKSIAESSTVHSWTWEFPKIRGTFWGHYNKDPPIYGTILGSNIFRNSQVSTSQGAFDETRGAVAQGSVAKWRFGV